MERVALKWRLKTKQNWNWTCIIQLEVMAIAVSTLECIRFYSCNNKALRLIESDLWYWLMLFHQICCKFAVVPWNTINTSIFIFWNFITCFIDGRIEERRKGVAENIVCLFTARQILYRQPVVHLNYRMVTYVSCSS